MLIPKANPIRDEEYRRWLHAIKPCRACGAERTQAAHLDNLGRGIKGGDDTCEALCPTCHQEFDTCPKGRGWWWLNYVAVPEARAAYRKWKG